VPVAIIALPSAPLLRSAGSDWGAWAVAWSSTYWMLETMWWFMTATRYGSTTLYLRQQRLLCISKDISNCPCVLQLALMRAKDVAKENKWGDRLEVRRCPADLASDSDIPVVLTMLSNATGVSNTQCSRWVPCYYCVQKHSCVPHRLAQCLLACAGAHSRSW